MDLHRDLVEATLTSQHRPDPILGYQLCPGCGVPVLDDIARRTGGRCPTCHRSEMHRATKVIEIRSQGRRIALPLGRKPRQRTRSAERKRHDRLVDRAKTAALRRLRDVFPELYETFLAEERGRLGLEPWPLEAPVTAAASETISFIEVYHALAEHGLEFDGPENSNEADRRAGA